MRLFCLLGIHSETKLFILTIEALLIGYWMSFFKRLFCFHSYIGDENKINTSWFSDGEGGFHYQKHMTHTCSKCGKVVEKEILNFVVKRKYNGEVL